MQPASTHHPIGDQASHDANDAPAQTFTDAAARMMHHAESNTAMQEARPRQLQPAHHARCSRSLALMRAHSAATTMSSFVASEDRRSKMAAALLRGFKTPHFVPWKNTFGNPNAACSSMLSKLCEWTQVQASVKTRFVVTNCG